MRTAVFLLIGLSVGAPAYAQAPWEHQGPGPGVPYVPGAPGVPGPDGAYVPGAPGVPVPYGYGSQAWRYRQMEAERRAHATPKGHAEGGGGPVANAGARNASSDIAPPPGDTPTRTASATRGGLARTSARGAGPAPASTPTPTPAAASTCATRGACKK